MAIGNFTYPADNLRLRMDMDALGYAYCKYCQTFRQKVEGTNFLAKHDTGILFWKKRCPGTHMPLRSQYVEQ